MIPQKTQAIQAALLGKWEDAIAINKTLIEENPHDIETLNRLAFAYTITGNILDAKKTYKKVLHIDANNPIATKNLKRLADQSGDNKTTTMPHIMNNLFLEESGKTKIVILVNTAPFTKIKYLQVGQLVELCIKRLKIFVLDSEKVYIGMLPDDISKRLIEFLAGGNIYEAYIKAVESASITVFLKETKRAVKFKNQSSFSYGEKTHLTFPKGNKEKAKEKEKRHDDFLDDEDA